MKFGDSVLYVEHGVEYQATVLASRVLDDHMGADSEPLLTLGFFKEVKVPSPSGAKDPETGKVQIVSRNVIGTNQQSDLVQFRHDVAHESHQYSAEQQKRYGVSVFSGGRWKEVPSATFTGRVEEEGGKKKKKSEVN